MKLPPAIKQEDFFNALLHTCCTDCEEATIMLLWRTGMHASTFATKAFEIKDDTGGEPYIHWQRPKTGKWLRASYPLNEARLLRRCIRAGSLPDTVRSLQRWVARIGARAGYAGISPLTLRHSRAIYLLDEGIPSHRVASLVGCSWGVLEKHYAQIEEARL